MKMPEQEVRVIKLGADAIFELLYETILNQQAELFDVDPGAVTNTFFMDWDSRQLICLTYKSEDGKGNLLKLPEDLDLKKIISQIPDTTESADCGKEYRTYTKAEIAQMGRYESGQ